MKFQTAALKFLVASKALQFGVRAQSIVVDRTSDTNVADAAVSDVLLERDSGGRFFPTGINNLRVVDSVTRGDGSISKTGIMHHTETLLVNGGGRFSQGGIINHYAVVDVINDDGGISSFTVTDGDDVSAQRKLIKSSKKVKHPEALCTLSLFADSLFMYANQCFTDIMVTISPCDNKDDTCYISERLPSPP